jgi:tRNA-dihydrouridine synthase
MFEQITIKDTTFRPAVLCAPMAGITHSAFRRLVSDFGGYGALFTEMLSGPALLHESLTRSAFTKRRSCEGEVFYQLRLNGREDIGAIVERLSEVSPSGIDLNLGCPAPEITKHGAGAALFVDLVRLESVLGCLRRNWSGILTVKCRLGKREDGWQRAFEERLRVLEACGVDALTVHPRFFDEKLKRTARWEALDWIASNTGMPLIANGDIVSPQHVPKAKAVMLGRIAVVKPWVFREFAGESVEVDYAELWERFYRYVREDFAPEKAIGRLKEFSAYYSRNFFFGHRLFRAVQGAHSLEKLHAAAMSFLSDSPRVAVSPSVMGI